MTRMKLLLAAAVVAAIVALSAGATAQTSSEETCLNGVGCVAHVLAAGSSAQYLGSALGADELAILKNGGAATSTTCVYHNTGTNQGYIIDNRNSALIQKELANLWVVWIAALDAGTNCPSTGLSPVSSGNAGITDVWADLSVDSTVGVRSYYAANSDGSFGTQYYVIGDAGDNRIKQHLWPDGAADVSITGSGHATNIPLALGNTTAGGLHVNVGFTDIRPEDAYAATTRANSKVVTTTWSGLGYTSSNKNIGSLILDTVTPNLGALPVAFALSGANDPITAKPAPISTTVPVGAAPIVFAINNSGGFAGGGGGGTTIPLDLSTGISPGEKPTTAHYRLANLFDGTTDCDTSNLAFDSWTNGVPSPAINLTVWLREPLSGTMNTTEFDVFRTFGNSKDTQEKGITNPTGGGNQNPLNLPCSTGGNRKRGVGTGPVINGIKSGQGSIGYFFYSWANAASLTGSNFNYLTLDKVDPIFSAPGAYSTCVGGGNAGAICGSSADCTSGGTCTGAASANQEFPVCNGPTAGQCPAELWGSSQPFPNVRNGTYKAWSLYRWIVADSNDFGDAYGPAHMAAQMQSVVNTAVTDFVPFNTVGDGLTVYRAHFFQTVKPALTSLSNGALSSNSNGATLGGTGEAGGDVGGEVQGPFLGGTNTVTIVTNAKLTNLKNTLGWVSGPPFVPNVLAGTKCPGGETSPWVGASVTGAHIPSGTTITAVTTNKAATMSANATAGAASEPITITYNLATPGALCLQQ